MLYTALLSKVPLRSSEANGHWCVLLPLALSLRMCSLKVTFWPSSSSSSSCRAEWPKDQCAPPYYPKFRNGWEPPAELFRTAPWETEGPAGPLGSPTSRNYRRQSADEVRGFCRWYCSLQDHPLNDTISIFFPLQFYGSHSSSPTNG